MKTPIITRNLANQAPATPRERFAGYVILKRTVDKCRATLDGTPGEYHFDGPLDNLLFAFKGITAAQFQAVVRDAKLYEDVSAWLDASGTSRTAAEITSWSDETEAASPMRNPEKRSFFIQSCSRLGLNPQMNTTFDWLEADDRETFRPKPIQPTKQQSMLAAAALSDNGQNQNPNQ